MAAHRKVEENMKAHPLLHNTSNSSSTSDENNNVYRLFGRYRPIHTLLGGGKLLKDIVSGRDVMRFLLVITGLWLISVVGSWFDLVTLLYAVTLLLLSIPWLYEKYEDQIDSFAEQALAEFKNQYAELSAKVLSKTPIKPLNESKND